MLFFQAFMTNLVLTKSSGPKSHAVAFTGPIFAGFSVCHTGLSGGGRGSEGAGLYYRPLTARYDSPHTSQRLAAISHGCGQFHPQILWANSPTLVRHRLCKTAVNVRVKKCDKIVNDYWKSNVLRDRV